MKRKFLIGTIILLVFIPLLRISSEVIAAPVTQVQQFTTPTPGPDGRIIYIVKANDTCSLISILTGVSIDLIRQMNKLGENCIVFEGQELVIGVGGPSEATATLALFTQEPTSIIPSATPFFGNAELCVAVYLDVNGDGLRQANIDEFDAYVLEGTEPTIGGGAVSLTSMTGVYSATLDTLTGLDPVCFTDVPEGKYTVSAAVPEGFNPTTDTSFELQLNPGDLAYASFGAQSKGQNSQVSGSGSQSPLLGVLGMLLLLGGIGIGIYAFRSRR
ncbi:LysM peptidoglycan-binding domain-containing protein [Chloroflexota bacterium]